MADNQDLHDKCNHLKSERQQDRAKALSTIKTWLEDEEYVDHHPLPTMQVLERTGFT